MGGTSAIAQFFAVDLNGWFFFFIYITDRLSILAGARLRGKRGRWASAPGSCSKTTVLVSDERIDCNRSFERGIRLLRLNEKTNRHLTVVCIKNHLLKLFHLVRRKM